MAARIIECDDQGEVRLYEDSANGTNYVGHKAAADVTAQYDVTWPGAPPGSTQFLQMDSSGVLSFNPTGAGTLDDGYDSGGAGAGRIITTDAGPLEAAGAGGFLASHTAPVYGLETTGLERNYRLTAGQTAGILEIQVGEADGDISDDVFTVGLSLDGTNRRLGLGTVAPATLAHFLAPAATAAKLTLEAPATLDASVVFTEDATARWEVGYDDSAGGLVVGRLSFADPRIYITDSAGEIGINKTGVLDALVHIFQDTDRRALFIQSTAASTRTGLRVEHDGTGFGLLVDHLGDAIALQAQNDAASTFACAVFRQRANVTGVNIVKEAAGAGTVLNVENPGTGACCTLDQNGDGVGLRIDSEATGAPLITLLPIDGNARGDITANGTARVTDASAPADGDLWFNSGSQRWKAHLSGRTSTFANTAGPAFGAGVLKTIAAGVAATNDAGVIILAAESGTADDLDTLTVTGSGEIAEGDTLILRADTGDTITVKHNTGNIHLDGSADKALVNGNQLTLIYDGTDWRQLTPMMVLP